jgi:hypothetical protein
MSTENSHVWPKCNTLGDLGKNLGLDRKFFLTKDKGGAAPTDSDSDNWTEQFSLDML